MHYTVYAVLTVCGTWCMQYSVYVVLGVYCTLYLLSNMWGRDIGGLLNLVFIGDGGVEDEKGEDERRWEIIMRNWNLREFRV